MLKLFSPWIDPYFSMLSRIAQKRAEWGIAIDDTGFHLNHPMTKDGADTDIPWNWLRFGFETRHVILLYVTAEHTILLPKRAFAGADELEQFRALLQEKLPLELVEIPG